MELLRPAALVVPEGHFMEQSPAEVGRFLGRRAVAAADPGENGSGIQGCALDGIDRLKPVVGKPAAGLVKEIVPLPQSLDEAGKGIANFESASLREMVDVTIEGFRGVDRQGP